MTEKKNSRSVSDVILESLSSFLFERITKEIQNRIRGYITDVFRTLMKKAIIAITGTVLLLIGLLFICISAVHYFSIYVPAWAAWLLVGLALTATGFLMAILVLKRD